MKSPSSLVAALVAGAALHCAGCAHGSSGHPSSAAEDADMARARAVAAETPANEGERALRRSVVASIDAFFRILAADAASVRLADSHVGKFLSDAYDAAAAKQLLKLKKVDLEMTLTAEELLGEPLTLLECLKLCREHKNQDACKLYDLVLQKQGKQAADVEGAAIFIADKETSVRAIAKLLFGGAVTQYGVGEVYAGNGQVHANIAIRTQSGAAVSDGRWQFHMTLAHEHWRITSVTKEDARSSARGTNVDYPVTQTSL